MFINLNKKQQQDYLQDQIIDILDREKSKFLTIQNINNFYNILEGELEKNIQNNDLRAILLNNNNRNNIKEITKCILCKNEGVQIYLSSPCNLSVKNYIDIYDEKYYIYMAKIHNLINFEQILHIFLKLPRKVKKNYVFKSINKEVFNSLK